MASIEVNRTHEDPELDLVNTGGAEGVHAAESGDADLPARGSGSHSRFHAGRAQRAQDAGKGLPGAPAKRGADQSERDGYAGSGLRAVGSNQALIVMIVDCLVFLVRLILLNYRTLLARSTQIGL